MAIFNFDGNRKQIKIVYIWYGRLRIENEEK